ncbi:MAG: CHAT domain-containing protein [Cyanobacteria bacterium J06598_3]
MAIRRSRLFRDRARFIFLAGITCCFVMGALPAFSQTSDTLQNQPTTPQATVQVVERMTANHSFGEGASPLIDQGTALFASGQLAAAADRWQQAATEYASQGNPLAQARALHYLALAQFNLGQWTLAQRVNTESRQLLAAIAESGTAEGDAALLGASLNLKGQLELVLGQPEQSIETWQQAAAAYAAAQDLTGQLGAGLNQAKALQTLGHHQRSQRLLEQLLLAIKSQPDNTLKATGLQLLGAALQSMGDLEQSQTRLSESLEIVQQLAATTPLVGDQISATRISLGQTLAARQDTAAALGQYQQAEAIAAHRLSRIEAQLHQLQLLVNTEQWSPAQLLISRLPAQLEALDPSRDSVYATVNFAASWIQMAQATGPSALKNSRFSATSNTAQSGTAQSGVQGAVQGPVQRTDIARLLSTALKSARTLSDTRAESFVLGQLGHLYEMAGQWPEAQQLTAQAVALAEGIDAPDLRVDWQWQLGRLLKQQGKQQDAIAAYSQVVASLRSLRQSLASLNPDRQFSYLETVEPVYRQLVSLLLESLPEQPQQQQAPLNQARALIESLQLAELDNFFHQACLQATPQLIDTVDATAAVLYPIILPDRLAVIVSRPGKPLVYYETRLLQSELESTLAQLRRHLNPHFFEADRLRLSQQVYDWLIRPAEASLGDTQTLVFVLDGALRNLPMAALYDGQQYLIERYSIALSPGLQLLDPQPLDDIRDLNVLTGGLSEAQSGFSALPAVDAEVRKIAATLPATTLLNQAFTTEGLSQMLQQAPFPLVHLATHGQFSSRSEETFLVTWDGRINVQDLDAMLRPRRRAIARPLELLVLSACQTATGDQRAALGLAGIAIRSGARSTLATLWQVNDISTATLMGEFYQQLSNTPGMTKAEALRAAQLSLLHQSEYQHPFYWASFVLVGNWL